MSLGERTAQASPAVVVSHDDHGPVGFRFLTIKRITWRDPSGKTRLWESAERTTRSAGGVDGVAVVAKVLPKGLHDSPLQVVIIKQFRPPIGAHCLELPAGLIDAGESAGEAALRELAEETGYRGRLLEVTAPCVSDPGMTNANMQVAVVEVDLEAPENASVEAMPEDGEFIEVALAPWDGLLDWLLHRAKSEGVEIDARLMAFAMGLQHGAAAGRQVQAAAPTTAAAPHSLSSPNGSGGGRQMKAGPVAALEAGAAAPFGSPVAQLVSSAAAVGLRRSSPSDALVPRAKTDGSAELEPSAAGSHADHSIYKAAHAAWKLLFDGKFVAGMAAATALGVLVRTMCRE